LSTLETRIDAMLAPVAPGMERMRAIMEAQVRSDTAAVQALVLLVGKAVGSRDDEHPEVAAIVELIHLATLVHDDVLDGARVRRRVACVNERWDNQIAVLLGDFLYARAFHLSTTLRSRLASRLLADTTAILCTGEIEQAALRRDFALTQAKYEDIAAKKTGSLYSAACELGARHAGGDAEDPRLARLGAEMAAFGREVGLAFQIVDDCLDVVGEEEVVGKSVGNDVEDGKLTLPVLHAWSRADLATRARMQAIYAPDFVAGSARRIELLRACCDLSAGVEHAMARAHELVAGARARLAALPASPAREALDAIALFTLERRF
jgi:octaprenyl-diphosphate synthase